MNSKFVLAVYIIVLVGGINWGLIGLANVNLVETIFPNPTLERIVYILVGLSAFYLLLTRFTSY
jgi:uncharacterized membrane protein YuzA (DUF378 family)